MLVPLSSIADLLRYPGQPERRLSLSWESDELVGIRAVDKDFPVAAGQPVLIDFAHSVCHEDWFLQARANLSPIGERGSLKRAVKSLLTGSVSISRRNLLQFKLLLPQFPALLMVGAGTVGAGCQPLYDDRDVRQIAFDIYPSNLTQFVGDAHQIPLADASVDGVVVQAVLEHVLDPVGVVAEIYRVLKPGGLVYAETPFMQQVHEGPYDFTRFTELGHRWLWQQFEEIERGVVGGPGLTLYWSTRYFWRAIFRNRRFGDMISLPFLLLATVDRFLPLEHKVEGANGVSFLGRRGTAQPLQRDELIACYLGPTL